MSPARALLALALLLPSLAAAEPRVATDPRMELMGLLLRLAGDARSPRNAFADAAAERFAAYSSHPAVRRLAAALEHGAGRALPAQYAVYLSSPPELSELYPAPPYFSAPFGGRAELEAWRVELSSFARVSGFLDWERETRPEREGFAAAAGAAGKAELGRPLARLLGARTWGEWTVVPSAFHEEGAGDSWVLEEKPGLPDVYVLLGPRAKPAGEPLSWGSTEQFAAGVLPEAVFTMAYAVYEACRPSFNANAAACEGQATGLVNPEDCVQQYWVRELTARVVEQTAGPRAAAAYRASWHGPFSAPVRAAVDRYLAERGRYRDLLDAADLLFGPFRSLSPGAACRPLDPARYAEPAYARRMGYYLRARLEARPDPAARAALDALGAQSRPATP
jgi:hypothetical protein